MTSDLCPLQASRLTATCRRLRRLGLEIGARPFIYSDTPQLVLDSFLQYTDSTRYTVSTRGEGRLSQGGVQMTFVPPVLPLSSPLSCRRSWPVFPCTPRTWWAPCSYLVWWPYMSSLPTLSSGLRPGSETEASMELRHCSMDC